MGENGIPMEYHNGEVSWFADVKYIYHIIIKPKMLLSTSLECKSEFWNWISTRLKVSFRLLDTHKPNLSLN